MKTMRKNEQEDTDPKHNCTWSTASHGRHVTQRFPGLSKTVSQIFRRHHKKLQTAACRHPLKVVFLPIPGAPQANTLWSMWLWSFLGLSEKPPCEKKSVQRRVDSVVREVELFSCGCLLSSPNVTAREHFVRSGSTVHTESGSRADTSTTKVSFLRTFCPSVTASPICLPIERSTVRFPVGMELCGGIRLCEVVDSWGETVSGTRLQKESVFRNMCDVQRTVRVKHGLLLLLLFWTRVRVRCDMATQHWVCQWKD